MGKVELKKLISEKNGITQKLAEEYIEVVFDGIKDALMQDGKVALTGIITLEVKDTPAKSGTLTNADGVEIEWSKEEGKKVTAKVSKSFVKEIVGE